MKLISYKYKYNLIISLFLLILFSVLPTLAETVIYSYDSVGRLIKVEYQDSGITITYEYDAAGNMIKKVVSAINLESPVADAGPDVSVYLGEIATLNGSASDPDGNDIVSWEWTVVSSPPGSSPVLDSADEPTALLEADLAGDYVVQLVVSDGLFSSQPDTATVSFRPLLPPVAVVDAGVTSGNAPLVVYFDGSKSHDPQGGDLSFSWDFGDGTPHSTEISPSHEYVNLGDYVATLTVLDERGQSASDTMLISVTDVIDPPIPDIGGRIVFISDRSGVENLWILNLEKDTVEKLTDFPGEFNISGLEQPQWSQDGKRILFAGWNGLNWQIFIINEDGQDLIQITDYSGRAEYCRWDLTDNNFIYCTESFGQYSHVFHKINLITGDDVTILPSTDDSTGTEGFNITSDGIEILFSRDHYYEYSYIGYQDMDGITTRIIVPVLHNRTAHGRINRVDGWIVMGQGTNFPASAPFNLFKMDAEGIEKVPLTFGVGNEMHFMPCWTRGDNNGYILFTSNMYGNWEIVMMVADPLSYPNEIINLTENPSKDREPDWTPITSTSTEMDSFEVEEAKIDFKKKPDDDKIHVKGNFQLGSESDGVDAFEDDVIVTIGLFSEMVIFELKGKGDKWEYKRQKGSTGGIKHMKIEWKKGKKGKKNKGYDEAKFDIHIDKENIGDISDWENPVFICIQIGDDLGSEDIVMKEHKHHWDYKGKKHH